MSVFAKDPWVLFWIVLVIVLLIRSMWKSRERTIRIKERGWPPNHLDANGDFREIDE
jgi:hypothetical protein